MSQPRTPKRAPSHGSNVVIGLPPLPDPSFAIEASLDRNGRAEVAMSGNIDVNNVRHVGSSIMALMYELEKRRIQEVRVDLRRLYFLNSSGLKFFVTWITSVSQMQPSSRRYRIVLVSNANLHWQKRSLGALQALEPNLVHLVEGDQL